MLIQPYSALAPGLSVGGTKVMMVLKELPVQLIRLNVVLNNNKSMQKEPSGPLMYVTVTYRGAVLNLRWPILSRTFRHERLSIPESFQEVHRGGKKGFAWRM